MYNEIRKRFIKFFETSNHQHIPSAPLVAQNDPTLLFTNSGMVQFKNVFLGLESADYKNAVTVQRCIRAGGKHNDLDNVGYTTRHHTFFEMLGNFSFGEYFKEKAIYYAFSFLTRELGINEDRIYVTVYHTDDESYDIWKKLTGFGDDKIIRISTNDNFWSMGDTGPCGPCSEIYYDYGDQIIGDKPGSSGADGDRFVEIWNLVFMEFEQKLDVMVPLSRRCIDTGMGLERIVSVIEGTTDNYKTSLFSKIINGIQDTYSDNNPKNDIIYRVVSDHIRAITFLIADGILPSNEGRGYVLRRIMRRAMRYIHQLDSKSAKMHLLYDIVVDAMGPGHSHIVKAKDLIVSIINQEETGFKDTLERGLRLLGDEIVKLGSEKMLSGEVAFKLYDTYGFPIDLTVDFLRRSGVKMDIDQFNSMMEKQRALSRTNWIGSGEVVDNSVWFAVKDQCGATKFIGYENESTIGTVLAMVRDGNLVDQLDQSLGVYWIVTAETVFYPESGGQCGDDGSILHDGHVIQVSDTQKFADAIIAHKCTPSNGIIKVGDTVQLVINQRHRKAKMRNHSATHLLHEVLREILGNHVVQKGSSVRTDGLRFDFSHNKPLSESELMLIEIEVNRRIIASVDVDVVNTDIKSAESMGAMALFGEKYGSDVRVIKIGKSIELCGGTHVKNSSDIGPFRILTERSIGSGIRRIECVSGEMAANLSAIQQAMINTVYKNYQGAASNTFITEVAMNVDRNCITNSLKSLSDSPILKYINQLVLDAKSKDIVIENLSKRYIDCILNESFEISGVYLKYCSIVDISTKILRSSIMNIRNNNPSVLVIVSSYDSSSKKYTWIVASLSRQIDCIGLASRIAQCGSGVLNHKSDSTFLMFVANFLDFGTICTIVSEICVV